MDWGAFGREGFLFGGLLVGGLLGGGLMGGGLLEGGLWGSIHQTLASLVNSSWPSQISIRGCVINKI